VDWILRVLLAGILPICNRTFTFRHPDDFLRDFEVRAGYRYTCGTGEAARHAPARARRHSLQGRPRCRHFRLFSWCVCALCAHNTRTLTAACMRACTHGTQIMGMEYLPGVFLTPDAVPAPLARVIAHAAAAARCAATRKAPAHTAFLLQFICRAARRSSTFRMKMPPPPCLVRAWAAVEVHM
jgi:hypothetical protein